MKKLSAFLTTIGFVCTLLTAFPVFAEEDTAFNPETDDFFIVVGDSTQGNGCVLEYCQHFQIMNEEWITPKKVFVHDTALSYGDILTTDDAFTLEYVGSLWRFVSPITEESIYEIIPEFEKVGTCEEFLTIQELTVDSVFELEDAYKRLSFSDADGNKNYQPYVHYDTIVDYPVTVENPEPGDVYTLACYQHQPLLLLGTSSTEEITPNGDANGDGILNILDVIAVNQAVLGKGKLSSDRIAYIDFNQNGALDSTDSLTMMKMIVGLA